MKQELLSVAGPVISGPGGSQTDLPLLEDRLSRRLQEAGILTRQVDKALEADDILAFRRLQAERHIVFLALEDTILDYTLAYLRSADMRGRKFSIMFTDSRALYPGKVAEWNNSKYLLALQKRTEQAVEIIGKDRTIGRTFIVDSFWDLAISPTLLHAVRDIALAQYRVGLDIKLVTVRGLDEINCPSLNFCVYENGLAMSLDVGQEAPFEIHSADRIGHYVKYHDDIAKLSDLFLYQIESIDPTIFDRAIAERATLERGRRILPSAAQFLQDGHSQYTTDVASFWASRRWETERRAVEEPFYRQWQETIGIAPPGKCLVAPAGTGSNAFIFADFGYSVTGIDASVAQIQRANQIRHQRDRALNTRYDPGPTLFRTLAFQELSRFYDRYFDLCLCLGGSLIHVSSAEIENAINNLVKTVRPGGYLLVDHRNGAFFDDPKNRHAAHPGHSRTVDREPSGRIVFHMTDQFGRKFDIAGQLHEISRLKHLFAKVGAEHVRDDFDHKVSVSVPIPEWFHMTFRRL